MDVGSASPLESALSTGSPTPAPEPTKAVGPSDTPVTPQPTAAVTRGSGVYGTVQAGPTCPVERPESPCPDRAVTDAKVFAKTRSGRTVNTTHTDSHGAFKMRLPSGIYEVSAKSRSVFGCDTQTVRVEDHRYTRVTITCDTGIR